MAKEFFDIELPYPNEASSTMFWAREKGVAMMESKLIMGTRILVIRRGELGAETCGCDMER